MEQAGVERVLKAGARRSVRLERAANGELSVVKRFAGSSLAGATLARLRAQREHRMLSELRERGLSVPRALALEHVDGGWEVRMEWIERAHEVAALLDAHAQWPHGRERGLRGFARLLAGLHAARVDHPDLHTGNALLDDQGRGWALDFHKARRVRELKPSTMLRDLVRLAAGVREVLGPRARARFFLAWRCSLPTPLRESFDALGPTASIVARIEREARLRRFEVVHARRARWTRDGTACRASAHPSEGFARHGVAPELVAQLDATARARDPLPCARFDSARVLLVTFATQRAARRAWWAAARLTEPRVPSARPWAVVFAPRAWMALEFSDAAQLCSQPRGARALRSLGRLYALLGDRALDVRAGVGLPFAVDAHGEVVLAAVGDVVRAKPRACSLEFARALDLAGLSLAKLTRRERAAFALGFLNGVPRGVGERARVRAELRHG